MINLNIQDETSTLKAVVLGTAEGLGNTPSLDHAYDPKSKEHIRKGTYPRESTLIKEMDEFGRVLEKYGVKVFRPGILENYNQIFSRDIGFVIDDKFVKTRILENRKREIEGISYLLDQFDKDKIIHVPEEDRVEGGDVMPWGEYLFVGYSKKADFDRYVVARTNEEGVDFLRRCFPEKKVKAFELNKSDEDPYQNALHLDCCFQPIGYDQAIIYPGGFKNSEDYEFLVEYFGKEKLIEITQQEMYDMNSNVFSISPDVIVSETGFTRLNAILKDRGFTVEAVPYKETAKLEGLFRCSTLPLIRER